MLIWTPILAIIFLGEQITEKELGGLVLTGIGTLLVQMRTFPYSGRNKNGELYSQTKGVKQ
jgi:drug/metabolite transporter (DMT)-like permease